MISQGDATKKKKKPSGFSGIHIRLPDLIVPIPVLWLECREVEIVQDPGIDRVPIQSTMIESLHLLWEGSDLLLCLRHVAVVQVHATRLAEALPPHTGAEAVETHILFARNGYLVLRRVYPAVGALCKYLEPMSDSVRAHESWLGPAGPLTRWQMLQLHSITRSSSFDGSS